MKLLRTLTEEDIFGMPYSGEPVEIKLRQAVRIVLLNERDEVALVNVVSRDFHMLPGGGVDSGEEILSAVRRECLEETGYEPKILDEVGQVIELRPGQRRKQISDCFLARIAGGDGVPQWTDDERNKGCQVEWYPLEEAMRKITAGLPEEYPSKFTRVRDMLFLRRVSEML